MVAPGRISLVRFLPMAAFAILFGVAPARANNFIVAQGAGGLIPDASYDINNNIVNSVTQFDINFVAPDVVAPGYSVVLTLLGLQYSYAADLTVNLTFQPSSGNPISADVFNQLGVTPSNPGGFAGIFGGPDTNGGNYVFNSDPGVSPADLWATTSTLGTADSVPEATYFPITALDAASNLSSAFAGVDVSAGMWVLTITNDDPSSPVPYNGWLNSLTGWELDINRTPEPSYTAVVALLMLGGLWLHRRKTRMRE